MGFWCISGGFLVGFWWVFGGFLGYCGGLDGKQFFGYCGRDGRSDGKQSGIRLLVGWLVYCGGFWVIFG